jgi:EAL domain-containing protein (putative c-di-GMP-specific phosphodiesterase class I)
MLRPLQAADLPRLGTPTPARRPRQAPRQAAEARGLTLLYQPRRALAGGRLLGAEATLCWPRGRLGANSASFLMGHLATLGTAGPVLAHALREACRAAAQWPSGLLSITLPACTLADGTLLGAIGAALAASGLSPERLEVAFAEPALATDSTEILLTLAALRDLGVGVALDGFGADSASLLTLKRLPLTALKLDRALVRDLPADRVAVAVVAAALLFAHALDVGVIACGVENEAQRDMLRRIGCDAVQGSLCGRPAAELAELATPVH